MQKEAKLSLAETDMKWRQRAKQHWLRNGDRNTTYFHMQANQRKKTNAITSIDDGTGRIASEQGEIGGIFTSFFSTLFNSSLPFNIDTCLNALKPKINQAMKESLVTPFTAEEVKKTIFQMNPLGSPGPDGFPAHFYQKHWELAGKEVCDYALGVLNQGGSLKKVNDTYIALIRKIISANQIAFVLGRLISDNTLVAYEVLHSMTTRMKVDGEPQQNFTPSRGIRQGDPISPYLFILYVEALSALLQKTEVMGEITSAPIGRGPTKVSYLFFANDNLLFCQALPKELTKVIGILDLYEQASGQMLNEEKSSVFFNKNTLKEEQELILQLAGIKSTGTFEKYLGLPAVLGRAKIAAFHSLIDRTWSWVVNWKTNHLSAAGKEILLKAGFQIVQLSFASKAKLEDVVIKQKYFSPGDLLNANLGSGPSYVWRSILAGLSVLKPGLRWRIENGKSINIWYDKWIPSLPSFIVASPRDMDCWCEMVSDLIDPKQRS
ncbi:uncharacterized protein LOC122306268 [Carya illinoinensis]|uniref:uncharacterized protein LOC122306268 n=1 Tax=Carya illinoinensis TaxID=32201 RepID=UPI001C72221C|nr:uncharacterized protein LOC122306268 [Carya illinoinensis]